MSKPLTISLIIIFLVHFIVFMKLYVQRKRIHHLFLAGAFVWLILYQVTRLWWSDLLLFGHPAYACFRFAAWITTGVGVLLYLRYRFSAAPKH